MATYKVVTAAKAVYIYAVEPPEIVEGVSAGDKVLRFRKIGQQQFICVPLVNVVSYEAITEGVS